MPRDVLFQPGDPDADHLDAFLDALVAGHQPTIPGTPGALTSTARHVHRFADDQVAPRLGQTESDRIWEDLMHTHSVTPSVPFSTPTATPPAARSATRPGPVARHQAARLHLVGSTSGPRTPIALGTHRVRGVRQHWRRRGWPIVELIGVAALIVGLVSVLLGGIGDDSNRDRPAVIPMAGAGTATPTVDSDEIAAIPDPGQTGVMPGPGIDGDPELVWRVPIADVTGDLLVRDGMVVRARFSGEVSSDFPNTVEPSHIEALTARAGTPVWQVEVNGSGVQFAGIHEGTVILTVSGDYGAIRIGNAGIGETGQGYVVGMDLASGAVNWSTQVTEDSPIPASAFSPTLAADQIFVPTSQGTVYALNATSGSIDWVADLDDAMSTQPDMQSISRPAVSDGLVSVYSTETGMAYALDAATGEENWAVQVAEPPARIDLGPDAPEGVFGVEPGPSIMGPVMAGGSVFFTSADYGSANREGGAQSIIALDAGSGASLWATDLEPIDLSTGERPYGVGQPFVSGDRLIVSIDGADGFGLTAFSTDSGEQVWDQRFGDDLFSYVSIVDGTGYVARADGILTGIDTETGDELWSLETGGELRSAPYIVDGMLFQAGHDGQLYALGSAGSVVATPGASTDISGLPTCDVEPRAEPETMPTGGPFSPPDPATLGTPAATLAEPGYLDPDTREFIMDPTLAWDELPVGTPADGDVVAAITETVDGIGACARSGDDAQVAAWFTEDFFLRPYVSYVVYASGFQTFTTVYLPVMSGDLRLLDDGRVGMIATEGQQAGEIGNNQATFYVFAEQPDGQWLIDEVVIVNNSGLAPQG